MFFLDYWQGVFVLLNKVRICVIPELKQIRIAWFQNWSWSEWEFLHRAPVLELTGCPAQFWNCSCMKQGILLITGIQFLIILPKSNSRMRQSPSRISADFEKFPTLNILESGKPSLCLEQCYSIKSILESGKPSLRLEQCYSIKLWLPDSWAYRDEMFEGSLPLL